MTIIFSEKCVHIFLLFTGGLFDGSFDTENAFKYSVAAINNQRSDNGVTLKAGTVDLTPLIHSLL